MDGFLQVIGNIMNEVKIVRRLMDIQFYRHVYNYIYM